MRSARLRLFLIGCLLLAALVGLRVADPAPVRDFRATYFDYLQRLFPRTDPDLAVKIVDIDEGSISEFGQWPWPRDTLAQLVDRLAILGAEVVVFDILFAEPDRLSPMRLAEDPVLATVLEEIEDFSTLDHDAILARSFEAVPVVLGTATSTGATGDVSPFAGVVAVGETALAALPPVGSTTPILNVLLESAAGIGSISMSPATNLASVRTLPLAWRAEDGAVLPTLALEALRVGLDERNISLWGAADIPQSLEGLSVGNVFIPTLPDGQVWLRPRPHDPEMYISARAVLLDDIEGERLADLAGSIVFVGTSAAGLFDLRTNALGETVPGVSIHAQLLEQMLSGSFLLRSDMIAGVELLVLASLGAIVLVGVTLSGPLFGISIGALGAIAVAFGSWVAFREFSLLFDAAYPLTACLLLFAGMSGLRLLVLDKERRLIRQSFSHYVAPEVLGEIERRGHKLQLGGETRNVTVMFSDIRGFTALSERLDAAALVSMLNGLFNHMTDEIIAQKGTIDKYIGDAIMAFWNAPIEQPQHQRLAARAAIGMRRAVGAFNAARPDANPIRICMGLASGPASVGNIGSKNRFNYSVVGDTVNVAARIEASCRHVDFDLLITEEVRNGIPDFAMLDAGFLTLKGVSERTPVYALVGDERMAATSAFKALKTAHDRLIQSLSTTGAAAETDLLRLAKAGDAVLPGLGAYLARLPERSEDYA